jgi:hypothetical protein
VLLLFLLSYAISLPARIPPAVVQRSISRTTAAAAAAVRLLLLLRCYLNCVMIAATHVSLHRSATYRVKESYRSCLLSTAAILIATANTTDIDIAQTLYRSSLSTGSLNMQRASQALCICSTSVLLVGYSDAAPR